MPRRPHRPAADRRGAILVLVAVLMPVIVLMVAFAIDVAWMQLVRTELRTATDAASRAGAKTLSLRQDRVAARDAAIEAASRNPVAGAGLAVSPGEVEFGESTQPSAGARFTFRSGGGTINAVRVTGSRTAGSAGGRVNLFFGSVLGTPAFEPQMTATSTMLERDICLVIDRSGSMGLDISFGGTGNGQNCGPLGSRTRFAALTEAVAAFVDELEVTYPEEHLALVSYSSRFRQSCPNGDLRFPTASLHNRLTTDYSAINATMAAFMQNGIGGSTAIGQGLREGIEALEDARPYAVKTIVLMTDGRHNQGVTPENVANDAARANCTVHTVGFSPNADSRRLRTVASRTGGQYYHADTAGDLAEAFREIARTLPVLITD
ncbi:TadE/TadG family type IV pilus assembly protein [Botrimarina sp.]|uniref:TadE/TadG family type IV pilus assembly protein n=1 Tax=Botrimarina sp. TaxID=2795802 RepID=UPI0032EDC995